MLYIYMLYHTRIKKNNVESVKSLGVYNNQIKAIEAIEEYKTLPGFKDFPKNFIIEKEKINKTYWSKGFNNTEEIQIKKYTQWRDE